MTATCSLCGEGNIVRDSWKKEFEHNGLQLSAEYVQQYCDGCGSLLQTPEVIRQNARNKQRAKNAHEGLLCGEEIRALRERFGLKQKAMATLFGGGPTAFAKYEADEIAHNAAMDKLLRLCLEDPQNLMRLARQAGITLPANVQERINGDLRSQLLNEVEEAVAGQGEAVPTWPWGLDESCNDNVFLLRPEKSDHKYIERQEKVA
jgi:HTH-type transcriptional regulator/antitoxin MqsA